MKNPKLVIDSMFIEWCSKVFIKIFKEKNYIEDPNFMDIKYKSHKASYIENNIWKEVLDDILLEIKNKYNIDPNTEEGGNILESLEDTLTEPEIYSLILKKPIKKLVK